LEGEALEKALAEWTQSALPKEAILALDGKTSRGSRCGEYPAVHLLAAYCNDIAGVVGQMPVETDNPMR
jgi:hypothetical protein